MTHRTVTPSTRSPAGKCALIMAGGTGGHIFPGLAIAHALRSCGWRVHWLGGAGSRSHPSMESLLIPPQGFAFDAIHFGGVRGRGWWMTALLPLRLMVAWLQSLLVLRRVRPDVLVGLGGYITAPAGSMGALLGIPLVLHEQNAVAGLANRLQARLASRVFTAFPCVIKGARWVGNPLRIAFLTVPEPQDRFMGRTGPLRVLVIGGSQGAQAFNEVVPRALALIPQHRRPMVTHQSGALQIEAVQRHYADAGVDAQLLPFIDNMAQAMADADLVVCRAGASTVTEIAAVGAAALFVPYPYAVDDHQTQNARFLVDQGAAWLLPQFQFGPEKLAEILMNTERTTLMNKAIEAKCLQQTHATEAIVAACEDIL